MLVLFIRAIILYTMVFVMIRLMGKRQISELQPFDLVVTLLIADLASGPIGDTSVPLSYSVIPIMALFLTQQLIAFLTLKSEKARSLLAGKPQIVIAKGVLQEDVMRSARYSINDLMEQLRAKDVFDIAIVSYAIIETDGTLSVMLKGMEHTPTIRDMSLKAHDDIPAGLVLLDGKINIKALNEFGKTEEWLRDMLKQMGLKRPENLFLVSLAPDGQLFAQRHQKHGASTFTLKTPLKAGKKNG